MLRSLLFVIGMGAILAACNREAVESAAHHRGGRYEGIGVATPGEAWSRIADAPKSGSDKLATLRDDDYVVFVTDTQTGEVRECGNRSGFCIRIRPWDKPAALAPLPVNAATTNGNGEERRSKTEELIVSNEVMATE